MNQPVYIQMLLDQFLAITITDSEGCYEGYKILTPHLFYQQLLHYCGNYMLEKQEIGLLRPLENSV